MEDLDLYLKKYRKPLLAFSGGADSTYLLYKMKQNCKDFICVSLIMPNTSERDLEYIKETEKTTDIVRLKFSPLDIPKWAENRKDRCYYCKKAMFSLLCDYAEKSGCDAVFDGTNFSDAGKFRPGLKAKEEKGILSPLLECGITKKTVLDELQKLNISPRISDSCYATRISYGEKITAEKLDIIRKTENYIHSFGVSVCRASLLGKLMRIDVSPSDMKTVFDNRKDIVSFVKDLGIKLVTLDLEGFESGKQDR